MVIDANTKRPIPFVNVGVIEKNRGTVLDEEGKFHMKLSNNLSGEDIIQFSSLGYETYRIKLKDAELVFNDYPEFFLKPEIFRLNEVVVTNSDNRFISEGIGKRGYGSNILGYWKEDTALGAELATRIVAKKGIRRLKEMQFQILNCASDSVLVRVNFYSINPSSGYPLNNLNNSNKNILYMINKRTNMAMVDLTPYNIFTDKDFIASLELVKVYGNSDLGLAIGTLSDSKAFRRYSSQNDWEELTSLVIGYYILSDFLVSEKKAMRNERKQAKSKISQRTLSGFAISKGKMISNVSVTNKRTREKMLTDKKGRYIIPARKNDIIIFSKKEYYNFHVKTDNKLTANATLTPK